VVNEQVSAAVRLDHLARELGDPFLIRNVDDVRGDFIRRAARRLKPMGRFIKFRSPDVGEGERRALLGQAGGERATYSRSRAGHDCDCGVINLHKFESYSKWGVGNGEWGAGSGERGIAFPSPFPIPHSPFPLFPFLITGYIWSYQNSHSSFRTIKSQTKLRGWIMKNRRLTLAVVIVFAALMIGAPRWATSSSAAVDCGLGIGDFGFKGGLQTCQTRSAVEEDANPKWGTGNPKSGIRNQALGVHRACAPRIAASQKRKLGQEPD